MYEKAMMSATPLLGSLGPSGPHAGHFKITDVLPAQALNCYQTDEEARGGQTDEGERGQPHSLSLLHLSVPLAPLRWSGSRTKPEPVLQLF